MILDEGLHNKDPRFRLAQLQMALLRACRYLVAIRMHTRGMTVAQATAFFENNAYQTHHNAEVEALRGTDDPGYLRYQLGKLMILKLRQDLRRKEGATFNLAATVFRNRAQEGKRRSGWGDERRCLPMRFVVKHGIENNEELAHTGDERGLGVLTV